MIHYIYARIQELYGLINHKLTMLCSLPLNPLVLRIRITNKCNLKCSFCYQKESLNTNLTDELSLNEWKKIISSLPKWTIIDITGGEPFIANNFKEILKLLLDRGHKVSITTNGFQVSNEIIEFLVENKLYYLMVSVDGDREFHNKVRGNSKSYDSALEFIKKVNTQKKKLHSKLPHICIKSTVLGENSEKLIELNKKELSNLDISSHSLNLLFQNSSRGGVKTVEDIKELDASEGNTANYNHNDLQKISKDIEILKSKSCCPINIRPDINNVDGYLKDPSSFGVKSCIRPYSVMTIYNDGQVSPCDISLRLDNIRNLDYKLNRAFKTNTFKSLIKKLKANNYNKICDGCCLSFHSEKK